MEVQTFVERRAEKRAENHLKRGKQQILPALLGIAGSPYLLQAPCYQKPPWISSLTPPGSMCLDGRTISLLNETLNHCHFSPKKKAGKTVVCFLQTNGSPEVNSSFTWSHPSWEILLVEMLRLFHIQQSENIRKMLVKNILVCTQSKKYWTFQDLKPPWLNMWPVVCPKWPMPRTQLDRQSCHPLSIRTRTKRASACHQSWV